MAIYKPSLLDKFKDFVNGLKGNWDQYEAHVADFEAHLAESASDNVHGLKPVELWSGNAGEPVQLIYLSDSIDKFEKIVLWVSFLGQEFRDWYHKLNDYIDLTGLNLGDAGTSTRHQLYEMRISKTSNTILEITHNVTLTWYNDVSSITDQGEARLYGVLGVGKKE